MRKFKFLLGVILATALCVSYVGAQASKTEARRATPSKAGANNPPPASVHMDPEQIRAHVKFLASDLLEGRGTGQRGGDIAAEYIAAQFALYGLKPVGDDGTYFQHVPMVEVKIRDRKSTRLNSSHTVISYAVFCLKKKNPMSSKSNMTH